MIRPLIRQDWLLLRRDHTFALVMLIGLLAVAYALYSNHQWAADKRAEFHQALELQVQQAQVDRQRLQDLNSGILAISESPSTGLPNTVSMEFLKAPGLLAELSIGDSDLRPASASIKAMGRASDLFRYYQVDNPELLAQGRFDLSFVVVYLMPLLILALTYSVLSTEAESGALQLLLSQPVSAARVAWTRIGLRTTLILSVVIGTSLVAWTIFANPPPNDSSQPLLVSSSSNDVALRIAAYLVATAIYGGFWGCFAGAVAGANRSTQSNALIMLLAWVLFTIVIPAIGSAAAQTLKPIPSRLEYTTTARDAENQANANGRELLEGYLLDHPEIDATEKSAVAPFIKTFVLVQQRVDEAVAPIDQEFDRQLLGQQRLADQLAYFSPASLMQKMLAELAGTSGARHLAYERQAAELRQQWLTLLETPLIAGRRLTVEEFDALPRPHFAVRPAAQVLATLIVPGLTLLAFALAVGFYGQRRLGRFRPGVLPQ
ncbi:MAG: DUF3526 domain-containing protein [Lysobacterales bacterium]